MNLRKFVSFCFAIAIGLVVSLPARAVVVAEFDFESVNGDFVPNTGIGPAGILLEGAVVEDGVLKSNGLGSGLDIPLGALSPFEGATDWSVQFDFRTEDEGGGPLFSSDNSDCPDECNDDVAAGSLNIFLTDEGEVVTDAWFIGAIGGFSPEDAPLNDGEFHTIRVDYTSGEGLWELYIDDLDAPAAEANWPYMRDASLDRTRIADQTNPDFGFEDIDPGADGIVAEFDNFRIDGASPPPAVVTINRDTGEMVFESLTEGDFNFTSLSIKSASGSLSPEQWFSISGNLDGAGDGSISDTNWTIDSQTPENLAESGIGVLADDTTFSLGEGLWLKSAIEDIKIEIFDPELDQPVRAAVSYTGDSALFADLNGDGEISTLDWDAFVAGYGSDLAGLTGREAYFLADLNIDGVHNAEDFLEFVEAFDAVNGEGALARLQAVPEPAGFSLIAFGAVGLFSLRHRRILLLPTPRHVMPLVLALVALTLMADSQDARAELLVEYKFDSDTSDSSGNNRDGDLDPGDGDPSVSGGVLNMTGGFEEGLIIPLEDANPFDGSKDFTIDVSFSASMHEDEAGHLLLSSANFNDPTLGDNHSMSLFIGGGGEIFYDNFFVGDVVVEPPEFVIDEQKHELRVTYSAPAEVGEPGEMYMRVDGTWLGVGEIAPNVPDIADHEVRLGGSINDVFPFECEGSECAVREFLGELDDVRIWDEAFPPTAFSAEVDRATGDIRLKGGEFSRDVSFYELTSEAGAINGMAWTAGNLDQQNVDAQGDGSGESWDTLSGDANRVAEAFLTGSTLFDDGTTLTLPGAWTGGAEDLELTFTTTDLEILSATVSYVGEGTGNPGDSCDPNTMGDLDGNGKVEFADFLVLSGNFGKQVPSHREGDIDCNGTVEFADFLVLSGNFGTTVGGAESVPEPASWISLFPVLLLGLMLRKKQ